MHLTLETKRLCLRAIATSDRTDLVALDSDPEVMRYISGGVPNTDKDYDKLLPRMRAFHDQPYGYLAAVSRDNSQFSKGVFLGWFHLRPSVVDPSIMELGYRLCKAAWGQGLATEGSMALLQYAFSELSQTEVDACSVPENIASQAVMKKCGMKKVGEFSHPLMGEQCVRYIVRASEFSQARGRD